MTEQIRPKMMSKTELIEEVQSKANISESETLIDSTNRTKKGITWLGYIKLIKLLRKQEYELRTDALGEVLEHIKMVDDLEELKGRVEKMKNGLDKK